MQTGGRPTLPGAAASDRSERENDEVIVDLIDRVIAHRLNCFEKLVQVFDAEFEDVFVRLVGRPDWVVLSGSGRHFDVCA